MVSPLIGKSVTPNMNGYKCNFSHTTVPTPSQSNHSDTVTEPLTSRLPCPESVTPQPDPYPTPSAPHPPADSDPPRRLSELEELTLAWETASGVGSLVGPSPIPETLPSTSLSISHSGSDSSLADWSVTQRLQQGLHSRQPDKGSPGL